jgi:hypothetical protein
MLFLAVEKRWWYVDASSCDERFQNAGRALHAHIHLSHPFEFEAVAFHLGDEDGAHGGLGVLCVEDCEVSGLLHPWQPMDVLAQDSCGLCERI